MNSTLPEGKILAEEKKIESVENKILANEEKILEKLKSPQFNEVFEEDSTRKDEVTFRRRVKQRIAKHRFLFALLIAFAVVLIWRGLWEITEKLPLISESVIALLVGIGILWFFEKYTELH